MSSPVKVENWDIDEWLEVYEAKRVATKNLSKHYEERDSLGIAAHYGGMASAFLEVVDDLKILKKKLDNQ